MELSLHLIYFKNNIIHICKKNKYLKNGCRPVRMPMLTPVPCSNNQQWAREHQNWTTWQWKESDLVWWITFSFTSLGWPGACASLIWGTHGTRMHYEKKASQRRQCDALGNVLLEDWERTNFYGVCYYYWPLGSQCFIVLAIHLFLSSHLIISKTMKLPYLEMLSIKLARQWEIYNVSSLSHQLGKKTWELDLEKLQPLFTGRL